MCAPCECTQVRMCMKVKNGPDPVGSGTGGAPVQTESSQGRFQASLRKLQRLHRDTDLMARARAPSPQGGHGASRPASRAAVGPGWGHHCDPKEGRKEGQASFQGPEAPAQSSPHTGSRWAAGPVPQVCGILSSWPGKPSLPWCGSKEVCDIVPTLWEEQESDPRSE